MRQFASPVDEETRMSTTPRPFAVTTHRTPAHHPNRDHGCLTAFPAVACDSDAADEPTAANTSPGTGRSNRGLVPPPPTRDDDRAWYGYWLFAGSDDVPVTFTLPEGWTNNGWGV